MRIPDRGPQRLDEYWNAINARRSAEEIDQLAESLDSTLIEAINRARTLHRRHRPDPVFAKQLEQQLMNLFVTTPADYSPLNGSNRSERAQDATLNGVTWPERWQPKRWSLAHFATVALIALTLAVFFFSVRNNNHHTLAPATPDPSPTTVTAPSATVVPVTMYRGDLERTGVMPGPAPSGRPGVLWQAEIGSVIQGPLVVGNGLVYTGTDSGSVHAFDMTTGIEVWKLTSKTTFESPSIVLDGATAYIAGFDGMVLAVDATTGTEYWRTDPALNVSRRVAFDVATSTLYVGGIDAVSYAFNSVDGSLKWQVPISAPQRSVANAVVGDRVYFGTSDGMLYALNTADGSTKWTWDSEQDVLLSVLFSEDTIFVPTIADVGDFAFVAIDTSSGTERWRVLSVDGQFTAGAILDGNVIFGSDFGEVTSVAATDGHVNWTFAPGNGAVFRAPPSIIDHNLYMLDTDGYLYALDSTTGKESWRVNLVGGGSYPPVITGGVIYLNTQLGSVYALGDGGTELPPVAPWASPISASSATPAASPAAVSSPGASEAGAASDVDVVWETTGGDISGSTVARLTIAPDDTIWVADPGNNGFQIFDADGNFLESWAGPTHSPFDFTDLEGNPFGAVAFAEDGSFYVLDYGNRQVVSFSADRTYLSRFGEPGNGPGQFMAPVAIAVDPAGNVAVWDPARGDLQTFAQDGTLVSTTPLQTTYSGGFSSNGMTIDENGNVYVVEFELSEAGIVEEFDPDGNLVRQFGSTPGPGQLQGQPLGIGIDAVGNIYVTEIEPSRVVVYSPTGEYLSSFGAPGDVTIELGFPFGIAVDQNGDIYVTDAAQNKLVKLRLPESISSVSSTIDIEEPIAASDDVALLWEISGGEAGLGSLALAPDGTIWVADVVSSGFQIFDTEGNFIESWTGTGDGAFTFMRANGDPFNAITFAADGSFYVMDTDGRRIQAFASDRTFLRSIGEPGREPGQFLEPIDVVLDLDGNLAVLDDQRRDIQIFSLEGALVSTIQLQTALPQGPNMNALAIDADGNFYVAGLTEDAEQLRIVEKFDRAGNLLQQFGLVEGPGKLTNHPFGIAVDTTGNLYVSEAEPNARVLVFTASGEYLTEFGGPESISITFVSHGDFVLDGQGNAYVTDWGANRLVKLRLPESLAPARVATPAD